MCKVVGCSSAVKGRGYCTKHYQQFMKHGKILKVSRREFNELIIKDKHCELVLTNNKAVKIGRAKIDKEDLDKVKTFSRWSLDNNGYVVHTKTNTYLHVLIMNNKNIDHIKTGIKNRADNRKSNLRVSTHSENLSNRPKQVNNTSGYKGVWLDKNTGNWRAEITSKRKKYSLGAYRTPEEASEAYKKAAKKLHGKFCKY